MNGTQEVTTNDNLDIQVGIRVAQIDLDLLNLLARQDRAGKSALIRRLIHEEARRRGLVDPIQQ